MVRPIDFRAVRQLCSPLQVLRAWGWRGWREASGEYRGPCPIHRSHSLHSRSLAVSADAWYCHVCMRRGDVADLIAWLDTVTPYEGALRACQLVGAAVPYLAPRIST